MVSGFQPSLINMQEIKEINFKFLRKLYQAYGRQLQRAVNEPAQTMGMLRLSL